MILRGLDNFISHLGGRAMTKKFEKYCHRVLAYPVWYSGYEKIVY